MTPVFGHGHLRLYLLSLLALSPRHGYELIQALSGRFGGTYVPSAGTIYPRLAKLEEDGLVTKTTDGRKTVYEITDAGRAELASRLGELDGIETELSDSVRRLADEVRSSVTAAMKTLRADLASAARETPPERAPGAPTGTADAGRGPDARTAHDPDSGSSTGSGTDTDTGSSAAHDAASGATADPGSYPDSKANSGAGSPAGPDAGPPAESDAEPDASATGIPTTSSRIESRVQLQRAEMMLSEFRQQVRTDLRTQVIAHSLDATTVDLLGTQLDAVRAQLRTTLAGPSA
jgi:DNA-binding PadR family transcriptional regulator